MAVNLPVSKIESETELKTKDILSIIQDVHVYFDQINTINGFIQYRGYYGGYTIEGISNTNENRQRYAQHERLKEITWFSLSITTNICGHHIHRQLMNNGVYV